MYIYNVTAKVDLAVHESWLRWMKEVHIPDVLSTGLFTHHRILHLLEQDESDGVTYAIQYFCSHLDHYHTYIHQHAPLMRQHVIDAWGEQVYLFRTIMEVIN
ncbi:DUF4286 family protein [Pollutibacter soli]|uniref:DUF4286 family protein n=1 Tax=Pollutibacter soli TaxID=3034157 RepID=UPI00301412DB